MMGSLRGSRVTDLLDFRLLRAGHAVRARAGSELTEDTTQHPQGAGRRSRVEPGGRLVGALRGSQVTDLIDFFTTQNRGTALWGPVRGSRVTDLLDFFDSFGQGIAVRARGRTPTTQTTPTKVRVEGPAFHFANARVEWPDSQIMELFPSGTLRGLIWV